MITIDTIYKFSIMLFTVVFILVISNLNRDSYINIILTSLFIVFILLLLNNYLDFGTKENMENTRKAELLEQNKSQYFVVDNNIPNSVTIDDSEINNFNSRSEQLEIVLNNLNCYDFKPSDTNEFQYNILYRHADIGDDVNNNETIFKQ